MGKLCECDQVPLEMYTIVEAERDALRTALRDSTRTIRELIAMHSPKEASTYRHQQIVYSAQALAVDHERLIGVARPNGTNGTNGKAT